MHLRSAAVQVDRTLLDLSRVRAINWPRYVVLLFNWLGMIRGEVCT